MAADALTEPLLDRGPVSGDALARYEADFRRAFGPRWRAQRALGWAIDRPPLFGRLTARLSRRPDVAGLCAQVAGGVVPLKSLFHPRAIGALLL